MAQTLTSTDAVLAVADVSEIITNLTPSKTPFLTAIGRETTRATEIKWLEDQLRASKANAAKEGADAVFVARTQPNVRRNQLQIFTDAMVISRTMDKLDKYGRDREIAYQTMLTGKALKLDQERAYVSDQVAVERVGESVAGVTAGAASMIAASNTVDAAGGVITDELVMDVSEKTAMAGGVDADVLMVRFGDMRDVVKLGNIADKNITIGTEASRKIVNTVDVYVTPFHELRIVRNIEMNAFNHAFVLDTAMWKDVVFDDWTRNELAKTGDATKFQVVSERGLKHKNFASSGLIKNLRDVA